VTDIEDKIRALLARASHPNTPEEEARSCAVIAAKLMREHKIEVGAVGGNPFTLPSSANPLDIRHAALRFFFDMVGTLAERAIREQRQHPAPPPPPPAPRTPFDELFWDRWAKEHPTGSKPKRKHRRSKQARKNNPNRERKRTHGR